MRLRILVEAMQLRPALFAIAVLEISDGMQLSVDLAYVESIPIGIAAHRCGRSPQTSSQASASQKNENRLACALALRACMQSLGSATKFLEEPSS